MVDRVRAAAKLHHEDSRGQQRMELYSKARGVEIAECSEVSVDALNAALSSLEDNTSHSMTILKRAFIQESAHIVTFLRHKSALHFIVGRLISSDPYEQLEAMECCCNASLGDAKSCSLIAKAGAVYMIQIIHGTNINLIQVALITLGNLSMSSVHTCKLLHEQGILPALWASLKVDETRGAAAKSFCQFSYTYLQHLSDEEVVNCVECSLPHFEKHPEVQWLVGQLSARESARVRLSSSSVVPSSLRTLNTVETISTDNLRSVVALIRLLGNMANHIQEGAMIRPQFEAAVASCSAYPFIRKEYDWFIASLRTDSSVVDMEN